MVAETRLQQGRHNRDRQESPTPIAQKSTLGSGSQSHEVDIEPLVGPLHFVDLDGSAANSHDH
jgi:hypothetical protein